MGGLFGVISKKRCVNELFYGIDYHSHLGTKKAGMAVFNNDGLFARSIHNLEQSYFRIKFEPDLPKFNGSLGIGAISDTDSQPILVNSHLGKFAISTVAKVVNLQDLENEILSKKNNFIEFNAGKTNQTEVISHLITERDSFTDGIKYAQQRIKGSCSMLILTPTSIIAARDFFGRTPLTIGKGEDAYAVASEDCSFSNLGFEAQYYLGPGEIVEITVDGFKQLTPPASKCQICSFLWIYYGNPTSNYEGINADAVRHRLGELMGKEDNIDVDLVSPIPDSGTCMAIGYAQGKGIPYRNAIIKYSATWPRSFTPADQSMRNLVAKMKLLPNYNTIRGKRVCFCDDSIVRGTQLRDNVQILYGHGVKEVYMRISCPPLVFPCPFVNYTSTKSPLELITRQYIHSVEGDNCPDEVLKEYAQTGSDRYNAMIEYIRRELKMDSLKYNTIENLVNAIGLPKECICTHCFDGSSYGHK